MAVQPCLQARERTKHSLPYAQSYLYRNGSQFFFAKSAVRCLMAINAVNDALNAIPCWSNQLKSSAIIVNHVESLPQGPSKMLVLASDQQRKFWRMIYSVYTFST